MDDFQATTNREDLLKRIRVLEQSGLLAQAMDLDASIRQMRPVEAVLYWEVNSSLASIAGYRLGDFDREARRATDLILHEAQELGRPLPIGSAGFSTIDSATGTFDVLLGPIGLTAAVVLSNPVQFLLTVQALAVNALWVVRVWSRRDLPVPPHPTVGDIRQIFECLRGETPRHVITGPGVPTPQERTEARFEDEGVRIPTPGGTVSIGPDVNATITLSGDGTTTVIELRGRRRR